MAELKLSLPAALGLTPAAATSPAPAVELPFLSPGAPPAYTGPAYGQGAPTLMVPSAGMPSDVTASLATAPESRTAVMNGKAGELAQAKQVLDAQMQSVKLAQDAITYWNAQLLSSNSTIRFSAWQKIMAQLMQVKRLLPDMATQEQTIMRLEKDVAAERVLIDTWPTQAGLVGGYAGPAYGPRFGGYAPRFIAYQPRPRFF